MSKAGDGLENTAFSKELASTSEDQPDAEAAGLLQRPVPEEKPRQTPLYAWPLLALSVLMISSAAPVFSLCPDVPSLTLPAWRLQATTLLLVFPGTYQFYGLSRDVKWKILRHLHMVAASGVCLGLDMALWVSGLWHTSLPHSLFIMSAAPPIFAVAALIMRQPISAGELGGTALGVVGAFVLAFGGQHDQGATLYGDALTAAALVAYMLYFVIGRRLRSWIPLMTYMMLLTASAAMTCSIGAIVIDGARFHGRGPSGLAGSLFGWVDLQYLGPVGWLAAGPGIVGHTGLNMLLRWMHPLQITLPQTVIPVAGSLLGWAIGVAAFPEGYPTYFGGGLLLIATLIVLLAAHDREAKQVRPELPQEVQLPVVHVVMSKVVDEQMEHDSFWEKSEDDAVAGHPAKGALSCSTDECNAAQAANAGEAGFLIHDRGLRDQV